MYVFRCVCVKLKARNSKLHGNRVSRWNVKKRKGGKVQVEKYLPEKGKVFVACQPGCSPSMPPYRNPFPWLVCSSVWIHETAGTLSGCLVCQTPIRGSNASVGPRRAHRNYWMSNGKSMAPDDSPRNTLTTRSPVSKRQPPLRSCLPCTPAHL